MICVIPARGGSKGIPNKNVAEVCGKPLITWTIKQAIEADCFEDIYVSTDASNIGGYALACGVQWIERPKEISGDTSTTYEAVEHTAQVLGYNGPICVLQATAPLRTEKNIREAVKLCEQKKKPVISAIEDSNICMWNGGPVTFSSRSGRQYKKRWHIENGSIYIYRNLKLDEPLFYVMENWQRFEIDEPFDLELVGWIMKRMGLAE